VFVALEIVVEPQERKERELSISMAEVMPCYENAMAERMNGI
jgi:hypothetical protein